LNFALEHEVCFTQLNFASFNTFISGTLKWETNEIFPDIYSFWYCTLNIGADMTTIRMKYIWSKFGFTNDEFAFIVMGIFSGEILVHVNVNPCHTPDCHDLGLAEDKLVNIVEIVRLDHHTFNEIGDWNYQNLNVQCT
jgi:hypothetical protein